MRAIPGPNAYTHPNSNCCRDPDCYIHTYRDRNTYGNLYSDRDGYTHSYADTYVYSYADHNTYRNCYANGHSHTHTEADAYCEAQCNTEDTAHPAATSGTVARRGRACFYGALSQ